MSLAVLTNARAAGQRSMIGYGALVLGMARQHGLDVQEIRPASVLRPLLGAGSGGGQTPGHGRARKLAANLDRFALTPAQLFGRSVGRPGRVGLVHVVDPGNAPYLPLIRHDRALVTVHDMIPYLAQEGALPGWRPSATGRRLMERIVARLARADRLVCVSQATRRDLLARVDIPAHRVEVIPNAVFQPMARATPAACTALRARLGLPAAASPSRRPGGADGDGTARAGETEAPPLILHVGRNFYKNRETVLEVFAQVRRTRPDAQVVMVGALGPALAAQAARLGLGGALHVLDHVAAGDMAALYSTASALLFPSHYEGFGLPVLEARICGTPVVCSDAGSLPEVAGPGAALFAPGDVAGMAGRLCEILEDPPAPAPADGLDAFSAETWAGAHRDLYRRLGLDIRPAHDARAGMQPA